MSHAVNWTTLVLDAHFQSIVMEGRHEHSKMNSVLNSLCKDVQELIETCRQCTKIKTQVNHLSNRNGKTLPYTPVPDYSIEVLRAFQ
jgi:hypothetical protein